MSGRVIACVPCRLKKVKCDGKRPQCESCKRAALVGPARILECQYRDRDSTYATKMRLSKGEACLSCRRKKTRCDATHPVCNMCKTIGCEDECSYRNDGLKKSQPGPRRIKPALELLVHGKVHLISPGETSADRFQSIETNSDAIASSVSQSSNVASAVFSGVHLPKVAATFPSLELLLDVFFSPRDVGLLQTAALPPLSDIVTLGTFSTPNEINSALSRVAIDDMNMTFALTFLNHGTIIGIYIPPTKQEAILFGDLSNRIINRFFVYFAHAAGCHIYGAFPFIYHKAYFSHLAFESLWNTRAEDDPFLYVQALQTMASFFLAVRYKLWAKRLVERAAATVCEYEIRFMPRQEAQPIPAFSEEIHERAVCLSQLIYAQICLDILDESNDTLIELESEMEDELAVAYPIIFHISPIILRVRTMMYARDARGLIFTHKRSIFSSTWCCQGLLYKLISHITSLEDVIAHFEELQDRPSLVSLKSSFIISLISLAEIYHSPNTGELSVTLFFEALKRAVDMTRSLTVIDLPFLDPVIEMCWSRTLSLLTENQKTSTSSEIVPNFVHLDAITCVSHMLDLLRSRTQLQADIFSRVHQQMRQFNFRRPGEPNFMEDAVGEAHEC